MKLSDQLKSILIASGWTQTKLALRLGVSFATVNSWINDRSQPRASAVEKITATYYSIVGTDIIDHANVSELKKTAMRCTLSLNDIITNNAILDMIVLQCTYNTNSIEGNTMTLADTREVLFANNALAYRTTTEHLEARNHQATLYWLLEQLQDQQFSFNRDLLTELHTRLMNGIIANAGLYRNHSVRISGTQVVVANYLKIPELIDELLNNLATQDEDPIGQLAQTHAEFERIHPFSDGNGRLGRLLMFALALRHKITPPLVPRERKYAYYKYLELAQMHSRNKPLEKFIAECILHTQQLITAER